MNHHRLADNVCGVVLIERDLCILVVVGHFPLAVRAYLHDVSPVPGRTVKEAVEVGRRVLVRCSQVRPCRGTDICCLLVDCLLVNVEGVALICIQEGRSDETQNLHVIVENLPQQELSVLLRTPTAVALHDALSVHSSRLLPAVVEVLSLF